MKVIIKNINADWDSLYQWVATLCTPFFWHKDTFTLIFASDDTIEKIMRKKEELLKSNQEFIVLKGNNL